MGALKGALRQRDLRLLLGAGLVSQTGDWVLRIGLAYCVYAITGSTISSALLLLSSFVPQILMGSIAGVLVDRWDPRRTLITVNLLQGFALLPLLLVHHPGRLWIVYAVIAAQGCVQQFLIPAQQTLLPRTVDPRDLLSANALSSQSGDLSRLVGAALGGATAAAGGIALLALVDSASFLASAVLLWKLSAPRPPENRTAKAGRRNLRDHLIQLRNEWADGLRLCVHRPVLRVLSTFLLVISIGEGAMSTLFAPFTRAVLHADAGTYGVITSAQAVGGIAGGLLVAGLGNRLRPERVLGPAAVAFGLLDLAVFLYPLLSTAIWPAIALMTLVGLPGAVLIASAMTLLQLNTDDGNRGRVLGALGAVEGVALVTAISAAGYLATTAGIIPVLATQGVGYAIAGAWVLMALRKQRSPRVVGRPAHTFSSPGEDEGATNLPPERAWADSP